MKFTDKIKSFFAGRSDISQEFFEDLADLLVEGDIGAQEAYDTVELLRQICKKEKISQPDEAREKLAGLLEKILVDGSSMLSNGQQSSVVNSSLLDSSGQTVILLLGVNGVGKTTTAAKIASMYKERGRNPVLAAADTFRAAAIDQLKIHGERLGLRVVAHQQGGDPAAVVYDAIEAAGGGAVIADTAGRMHTKSALVEELRKIDRIVESKAAGACYVKYLVLDATTGRNALAQAEIFSEAVSPRAAILTKYDSTAKGGVVFSLASVLHMPVAYLCTGEKYGDIMAFDPHDFAREFAGII
ncbi:MAG: signal recognition particle-docking protein FtsY [Treponema sp.]|jgi:fused signal recognition particle receptor|nr:signal recognition particle-docking protein FtsY [Treponema sp.]